MNRFFVFWAPVERDHFFQFKMKHLNIKHFFNRKNVSIGPIRLIGVENSRKFSLLAQLPQSGSE